MSKATVGDFSSLLRSILPIRKPHNPENDRIMERNQIINDLKSIQPENNYKIFLSEDYISNIINDRISIALAEKQILQKIVAENTMEVSYKVRKSNNKTVDRKLVIKPKLSDIEIKRKLLVYVPIWNIELKSGDFIYNRKNLGYIAHIY